MSLHGAVRLGRVKEIRALIESGANRTGRLTRERLELAAYLGHPGSRSVVGEGESPTEIQGWIRGLIAFPGGVVAGVRAAVCASGLVLHLWEARRPNDDRPARLIAAAARWARDPSPEHARSARGRLSERIDSDELEQVLATIRLSAGSAEVAQSPSASAPRRSLFMAASASSLAAGLVGEVRTRQAITRAVVPWVLGSADPLEPGG